MIERPKTFAGILSVFLATAPAHAESYAGQIADGAGWTTTGANGRELMLTLNPDGTGQMRLGFIRRSLSWRESGERICLNGLPDGERCITFAPIEGGGFASVDPDPTGPQLVLRR